LTAFDPDARLFVIAIVTRIAQRKTPGSRRGQSSAVGLSCPIRMTGPEGVCRSLDGAPRSQGIVIAAPLLS
jgi:hypothetical protein